jgi:hypothetical protein
MPFLFRATPQHGNQQPASSLGSQPESGRALSRPIRRHPRRYETTAARDTNSTIRAICARRSLALQVVRVACDGDLGALDPRYASPIGTRKLDPHVASEAHGRGGLSTDLDSARPQSPVAENASISQPSADGPGWVVPGVFALLLVLAVSRSPYLLTHGRFWAEEGTVHFQHMFEHPGPGSLFFVYGRSGYLDAFCNVATWLAAHVSLMRAPLVTVWLSFGVIVGLLWITLYWPSALLPTRVSRVSTALMMVVGTVAIPGVWLNSLEAQTYLTLTTLLLLFVHLNPLTRRRFLFGGLVLATAGLSGVYAGLLAPLFIVRALMQRSRRNVIYAAVAGAAAAIQLAVVAHLHASAQTADTKLVFRGAGTIVRNIAAYHIAGFVFGPDNAAKVQGRSHTPVIFAGLCGFAIVVLALLAAMLVRVRDRRVPLALAAAFLIEELGINYGASNDSFLRFAVVPIGILILMLVHGTAAANRAGLRAVGAGLCALVLLFGLSTFWTYQPSNLRCRACPDWAQQVHQWQQGRSSRLESWPYPGWYIRLTPRQTNAARTQNSPTHLAQRRN